MKVALLVLGDVGRSPRMQYSASCLAKQDNIASVHLIGYSGSQCFSSIMEDPKIEVYRISPPIRNFLPKAFYPLYVPFRLAQQFLQLVYFLIIQSDKYEYLMIQNPPSIPTIVVSSAVKALKGTRVIIDWHNLGYTLLAQRFGKNKSLLQKLILSVAKWHDHLFPQVADFHFTVTDALREYLLQNLETHPTRLHVLYDRPNSSFQPLTVSQKHQMFCKLSFELFSSGFDLDSGNADILKQTPFTLVEKTEEDPEVAKVTMKKLIEERPLFIVSSTSYTPDENFHILLDALIQVDDFLENNKYKRKSFPAVLCVVTGKGPLKSFFQRKISVLALSHVVIKQMWVESEDYASFLSCADLGVSLHTSSSGLDLPMKIVDMFGAGIPVCAANYKCIKELMKPGVNGLLFSSSQQLSKQIFGFIQEHKKPKEERMLHTLKKGVHYERKKTWEKEWQEKVAPVFMKHNDKPICSIWSVILLVVVIFAALTRLFL